MALELQQAKAYDGRVEKIISFRIGEFIYQLMYWVSHLAA